MENFKKFCKEKSITFFFPIALVLTIVPLIVRMRISEGDKATLALYGPTANTDLFTQNKAFALMGLSALLIIVFASCFKKFYEKKDKIINIILILSLLFLGLTFLSAIMSEYRHVAFWGIYDRSEGFFTTLCYIILFVYSIYTFKNTQDFRFILIPILIVTFINGFLGLFQYFGEDLIKTSLGGLLCIPDSYNIDPSTLSLSYEAGKLYGTLYHYNYVGSFTAIVLPIMFGAVIFEDDIFLKLLSIAGCITGLWLLFGSTSRAGLIGFGAIILFACIFLGKILFKNKKPFIIGLAILLIILAGLGAVTKGNIFSRIPSLVSDGIHLFSSNSDFNYLDHVPVKNVETVDGVLKITLPDDEINVTFENNDYVFRNSNGDLINYVPSADSKLKATNYTTEDSHFSNISFRSGKIKSKTKNDGLVLNIGSRLNEFMFTLKDDNTIHLIKSGNFEEIDLDFPESIGFNGKEKIASARGYIWSRSIPLLKNTLLIGDGPDTFSFYFPQNDLIGKLYAYDTTNMIVSKAHNLYLQLGINNGVTALIIFLGIVLIYTVDSFKLYALKKSYTEKEIMGISIFLGVIGYLFTGLFNDSVVCVAPIFWVIFGTGIAVNFMNRKDSASK